MSAGDYSHAGTRMTSCSCGRTDGVLGYGNQHAKTMFIGIAPGADEWRRTKRPLTGPSGFLLDRILESVGIERSETFCTNLVCFWKDAPSREEIAMCSPRLSAEITRIDPETIVLLGKIACETMLDIPFKKARGAIIKRDNRTWIATYHPAACLHRATTVVEKNLQIEAAYSLCRDLNKLTDSEYLPRPPIRYTTVTNLKDAQDVLDSLANEPVVALDIETNYDKEYELAHPFDTDIVCVGIGASNKSAYVLALGPAEWRLIRWPTTCKYAYHNGVFDTQEIMRHTGVWLPLDEDTMLQSYSIDERSERGLHKLKSLARELCLDPNTRVLKSDLNWTPVGDIEVGDTLIGFEEYPIKHRRNMLSSVVMEKHRLVADRYRIALYDGEKEVKVITCTPEHSWLAVSPKGIGYSNTQKYTWRTTAELNVLDRIAAALPTWEQDESKEAYYLQAFFDGEGWVHITDRHTEVAVGQLEGPVLDYVCSLLNEKGFQFSVSTRHEGYKGPFHVIRLTGDRVCLRFLGQIRPRRLLEKSALVWNGRATWGNHSKSWTVLKIDKIGKGEVIGLKTSTRTFLAEGLLSHNCGADFYEEEDHHVLNEIQLTGASPEQMEIQEYQLDKLYEYNAKDVVYTWRLHQALSAQQDELDKQVYRELLLPAAIVLRESQYRGIYIDQEAIREIGFLFIKEHNDLQAKLKAFCEQVLGDPDFNPRSPVQVRKMLEYQGYALPNTQKATLLNLLDEVPDIPFITDLLRLRTLDKLLTSYMTDIINQIKYDGRVHPHAFLIGTVTGRLTYTKPAMQTLPKPKTVKDLGMIRKLFAATNDDYILLEADYAQIEAWLGAYFSEDDNLLADLQSSDWHTSVAEAMFGKTKQDVPPWEWAHLRDAAKHINYGSMYGEEAQGLTRRPPIGIGCDLQTAKDYLAKWRAHYPTFVKYQEEQKRLAMTEPYIVTPFGRKRRFPIIVNDHQLRQAVNCKIQSTASDYTLSSAIRLHEPLKALDTHLLFIEHDAIYLEVRRQHLAQVVSLLYAEMEAPPLPGLPSIRIEIETGPNLAELEKIA